MDINLNQDLGVSAQWKIAVCTPTPSGDLVEYPYGEEYQNNAILNWFLSGMILHVANNIYLSQPVNQPIDWPEKAPGPLIPAYFTRGAIQLGTGIKPITYNDSKLDRYVMQTNFIRGKTTPPNLVDIYIPESGMAIFEKTYEFSVVGGNAYFTEAGFKQQHAGNLWNRFPYYQDPIYTRFLFTKESPVTGFISGILNQNNTFSIFNHPLDQVSGVISTVMTGNNLWQTYLYEINPKTIIRERVTGFISGYMSYLGQFTPFTGNSRSSGFLMSGQKIEFPPYRVFIEEPITGYISGNMTELNGFIPYTGDGLDSSGYYLSGQQYEFQEPFNQFSGLSGFENGYNYYGFNFVYGSGFISDIPNEIYGNGKATGIIGSRNILAFSGSFNGFENFSGFDKRAGYSFDKFFVTGSGFSSGFVADLNNSLLYGTFRFGTGMFTGIIGHRNTFRYNIYSGLSGIRSHEYGWYFTKSGMFGESGMNIVSGLYSGYYPTQTGFSGLMYGEKTLIVGFISGYVDENEIFNPLLNTDNSSGYFFSGEKYYFPTGKYFSGFSGDINFTGKTFNFNGFSFPDGSGFSGIDWPIIEKQQIIGFLSGYMNENLEFTAFQDLYPELSSSGYFVSGNQRFFKTGEYFSGFLGESGIDYNNYEYSGFFIENISGFSGIDFPNSGTGIYTGIIGYKNNFTYPISGSGIMSGYIGDITNYYTSNTGILTGIVGYKKYISGVNLVLGQYLKVFYRIAFRVPQYTGITHVTGNNIVYGDFNGSGQFKFLGPIKSIFGGHEDTDNDFFRNGRIRWAFNEGGRAQGIWWPIGPSCNGSYDFIDSTPYLPLMPMMLRDIESLNNNPTFPTINTRPRFRLQTGENEINDGYGNISQNTVDGAFYPARRLNTLFSTYNGGYKLSNTVMFRGEWPNSDVDIGGVWFSHGGESCLSDMSRGIYGYSYLKSASGNVGWLYKFNTPQRKWEDQVIFINTTLSVNREQFFEDPYYGRYPQ